MVGGNNMQKSLIELAFEFVEGQKEPVPFSAIWEYVKKEAGLTEEQANSKAGQFFTNMMLDGRFVNLGDNEWDLRSRHTFDKVHIDMKDVYSDVETSDEDSEEAAEIEEYNQVFEDKKEDEGFGQSDEEENPDSESDF